MLPKATENVAESEHVPDQSPAVGQLQVDVHETLFGVSVHVTLVKLFTTIKDPPDIVRELRLLPVTEIGDPVDEVTSRSVVPFGVTKVLRIPEFSKVKVVAPVRVKV